MELHSPPQKKGRKNIKFSARKVARPVHGVRMRELLDSKGRRKLFFFFFSKCRRYKTWNTNVPREAGGTIDTTTPIFTRIARTLLSFFLFLSPYTRTGWIAVLLFSLLNERMEEIFRKVDQATESGNLMTIMIVIKRSKISKNKTCN